MTTYKQPVKERSRELIWNHAVETLTSRRNDNRILNTNYMEHLWLYCQQWLEEKLDTAAFVKWKEFADICYGQKRPEELKVAFFCGNEPENDVRHLLNLGVRIENIYAFEHNKKMFKEAVESLHDTYPLLKIYKGKIEEYADLQNTKFDIVYLDFTGTLLKEYKTVVKLLDMNALTDMSVLIVNTCYPDPTDDNIDFLANFFYTSNPQPIGFSGILLAKRQNSFYCTYFLHNRNVADTKSPYPIKRLEVIRWFNQKSMVFNQSLS